MTILFTANAILFAFTGSITRGQLNGRIVTAVHVINDCLNSICAQNGGKFTLFT
jgi:hypothetical protein